MQATFMIYAAGADRQRLRTLMKDVAPEEVAWREQRRLFGSEFYLTGPAVLARKAQEAISLKLARFEGPAAASTLRRGKA